MRQTSSEIAETVRESLERYFKDLDGERPRAIYDMVLKNVEKPMLETVLGKARGQPDDRGGNARHQPQHAAQEDQPAQDQGVSGGVPKRERGGADAARFSVPPSRRPRKWTSASGRRSSASPTRPASSSSPRSLALSASRSSPPAAPRSCSRRAASRSPRSPTTPASRRCSTAGEDAAPEDPRRPPRAPRPARSTWRRSEERASSRSTWWSSTSTRSRRRSRGPDCTLDEAIENIDIGGPAMVRAAAKNHAGVAVVTDPADYDAMLAEMEGDRRRARGRDALRAREEGVRAHRRVRRRDRELPHRPRRGAAAARLPRAADPAVREGRRQLRYGENPHQLAAFYRDPAPAAGSLAGYAPAPGQGAVVQQHRRRRRGVGMREDASTEPACVIVKHANPCGVAVGGRSCSPPTSKAFTTDPTSAFGGIIAFNRPLDGADRGRGREAVRRGGHRAATSSAEARARARERRRTCACSRCRWRTRRKRFDLKRVGGGLLVQTPDATNVAAAELKVVTKRAPTDAELRGPALRLAGRQVREVQRDRVLRRRHDARRRRRPDEPRRQRAHRRRSRRRTPGCRSPARSSRPTRSSRSATALDVVAQAGAKAVIQPGGSVRDDEVIAAADEHGAGDGVHRRAALPALRREAPRHRRRRPRARAGLEAGAVARACRRSSSRPATAAPRASRGVENVADHRSRRARRLRAATRRSTLTVVGPEAPLAAGVVDRFRARGPAHLRPDAGRGAARELEGVRQGASCSATAIPTARYEAFDDAAAAHAYVDAHGAPIVVKADGLAAGKGVVVAATRDEAHAAIDAMLGDSALGDAGARVVIEEFLEGEEASFIVLSTARNVLPLATSQDHKRLRRRRPGPEHRRHGRLLAGAGGHAERARARDARDHRCRRSPAWPQDGMPFTGFLYAGLMIDAHGTPKTRRVQLPPRRPRDAADPDAPEERPVRRC